MSNELTEQVRSVLADVLGVPIDSVGPEATADTMDTWDSVTHVSVVMALEAQFDVSFTPEEVPELVSVPAIVRLVETKRR